MKEFLEILKYVLPALLVLATAYLMIKELLKKEKERLDLLSRRESKAENQKIITPIRIQAYERIVLFLERMVPNNLIIRTNKQGMNPYELQSSMIRAIRDEYEHNLSQQLYVSPAAWEMVKNAREWMINIINKAYGGIGEDANTSDYSGKIFELYLEHKTTPIGHALEFVREEMARRFE